VDGWRKSSETSQRFFDCSPSDADAAKKGALGGRSHVTAHIIERLERSVHFANGKRKSWGILLSPWYSASSRFRRNGGRFVKKLALSTLACESQGEIAASTKLTE
jgi:hypothetical protein